jgi:lysophospholipase L1-like esterase
MVALDRAYQPTLVWLLALLLVGCADSPKGAPTISSPGGSGVDPPAQPGTQRFLALGDSYTIGESVSPPERWPVQLVAALRARGIDLADPTILARTGWTTDELSAALESARLKGPYALVSLLIGVNNQYRGRDVAEYRVQFAALLDRAVELAGGRRVRVLVLSIPDWGGTPHGVGRRAEVAAAIDRFNAVNREETLRVGARYVEITEGSRRAGEDPGLLARDGLHPSGKMYAQWAEAALPFAAAALAEVDTPDQKSKTN